MALVPAAGLGIVVILFIVFCLGYLLTNGVVSKIGKRRKGPQLFYRNTSREVGFHDDWKEKDIEDASKVGGLVAVILVIILAAHVSSGWFENSWPWLTLIGILVGILSFALRRK